MSVLFPLHHSDLVVNGVFLCAQIYHTKLLAMVSLYCYQQYVLNYVAT